MRHTHGYHQYPRETPVIDAIGAAMAVASLVIGSYALLFLAFAVHHGDVAIAVDNGLFLVVIAVANGLLGALRHWRRHHG
jgi:hypothetical protein